MSVTVLLQIASSFLLLDGIEPFLAVCSPYSTLKTFFSIFDLDPITPKIYLPQICTCSKSPISRLVWQIGKKCLGLLGVFGDRRFNGTMQNVVGPTLVAMATKFWQIWAFFTKSPISRRVCQIDPICLGIPGETTRGADLCCHGNHICDRRGV